MKRKWFALLTVLALCLTLVVMPVFAADSADSTFNAYNIYHTTKATDIATKPLPKQSYEIARDGVVRVRMEQTFQVVSGGRVILSATLTWKGSAFAIGDPASDSASYFVTNRHVVEVGADEIREVEAYFEAVNGLQEGSLHGMVSLGESKLNIVIDSIDHQVPVEIVRRSGTTDLALIKTKTPLENYKPMILRFYPDTIGAETVYAVGFPGDSDDIDDSTTTLPSSKTDVTFTSGNIAKLMRENSFQNPVYEAAFGTPQLGSALLLKLVIHGGNSGGPVVDTNGLVVGVATWGNDVSESLAVTSNELRSFLRSIDTSGFVFAYTEPGVQLAFPLGKVLLIAVGVLAVAGLVVAIVMQSKRPSSKRPNNDKVPSASTRHLVCETGALRGQSFRLGDKQSIGRDPQRCKIVFPSSTPKVSGLHCTIRFRDGKVTVVDENSSCGTFIDNVRIQPGTPVTLHRGHRLSLGSPDQTLILKN